MGLLVWLVLGVAVQLRYGGLDTFVLVGWGAAMLVCVVFIVTPWLHTAPREPGGAPAVHRNRTLV